jgi:Na+/H+-dicarboxylate symporter
MSDAAKSMAGRILLHPITIFAAILAGGLYGWWDEGASPSIEFIGTIYVKLLQMCVIPLLITAVVTSLSRLFADGSATRHIWRIIGFIIVGLVIAGGTGLILGELGHPGSGLDQQAKTVIGEMILSAQSPSSAPGADISGLAMQQMVASIVPDNVFLALSSGNKLAILFFAMILGVGLGSVGRTRGDSVIVIFEIFYSTFLKIIEWLMYALPVGLFCLAYGQSAAIGVDTLFAMLRFIVLIYAGAFALILFYSVVIWARVGGSYWHAMSCLKAAIFVAFGTSSGFAAVPEALRGLKYGLKLDENVVDLVMPLGITLNPPGTVFHFALATVFLANIYGVDLSFEQLALVLIGSALAGVAASGSPGVAALSMISIVLVPLGLPVEVAVILLVAIDPIVDPILTVLNLKSNCALTCLTGPRPVQPRSAAISEPS